MSCAISFAVYPDSLFVSQNFRKWGKLFVTFLKDQFLRFIDTPNDNNNINYCSIMIKWFVTVPILIFYKLSCFGIFSIICYSYEYLHSPLTTYNSIYVDNSFQLMMKPFLKSLNMLQILFTVSHFDKSDHNYTICYILKVIFNQSTFLFKI